MSDLLPPNATTQERAISLAVDRAVPVPNATLWSPWTCPAGILPWLAWALSVDEWDSGASEDRKREIIAESIDQHRVKGTVYALKRALQQLGYEVEIDEQTGTAYTFGLNFKVGAGESAGGAVVDAAIAQAEAIALRQKNARSELIRSRYLAEGPGIGGPLIASAAVSGSETDVTNFEEREGIWIGGAITPLMARRFLLPCPDPGPYGELAFSTSGVLLDDGAGNIIPPESGIWMCLFWISVDSWALQYFVDGELEALWYATDGSGSTPIHPNPWEATGWTASTGATGTPTLTHVL